MENQQSPVNINISKQQQKRKANWRKDACLFLLQLIEENKHILEGKRFNQDVTAQTRKDAWDNITRKINAAFPKSVRGKVDVEKKWWSLKAQGREELCNYNKYIGGTGGGPAPKELSEVAIVVQRILGSDNASIDGIVAGDQYDAVLAQIRNEGPVTVGVEEIAYDADISAAFDVNFIGNTASMTVPVTTQTPSLPVGTSTPSSALPQLTHTNRTSKRSLFQSNEEFCVKQRKLELALNEAKVELIKAQTVLLRAQAAKLELENEHKALLIQQRGASTSTVNIPLDDL
ncbi:hypothetical protein Pcinc_021534 [Petrolisthes cinctipes]|uniref:Regulatory protein zeste n=1 Tax=Petrolisthes cinctipes TaxID=88211 RepID=A0AAE1KI77_PETCI|nr:hypothetical protein Pcinc_021534 [Petrolisthes cinctipes]